jgi:anti-sigma B factor antagonist
MAQHEHLSIESVRESPDRTRLVVCGDLDSATAPEFRAVLDEQREEGHEVVIDLSGVRFVDSTGLRVLVDAARADRGGWSVGLIDDLPANVRRVMAITGILGLFRLVGR